MSRVRPSEAACKFVERDADTLARRLVSGEFVVAATQILYKRVPGGDGVRRPPSSQSAHCAEYGFEPSVIALHDVVGAHR